LKQKQYAVLGLGRFGIGLATTLANLGAEVIAIDVDEEKIQNIADVVSFAVQADITDIHALESIGIQDVDVVIVSTTTDFNSSIMGVLNVQELGVQEVYVKTTNEQHRKLMHRLGITRVFSPEEDMGKRVAYHLMTGGFFEVLSLDTNHSIVDINPLESWIGKSLQELEIRKHYGFNIIAIQNGDMLNVSPLATDVIQENDKLVIICDNESFAKFKMKMAEEKS
jgi:trk system potassium uptake protein TrkA